MHFSKFTFIKIKVAFLEIDVTFLEIKVAFRKIIVAFLEIKVTFRKIKDASCKISLRLHFAKVSLRNFFKNLLLPPFR